jgi:3'(2'), 5'-bisphosphate nucleotidase
LSDDRVAGADDHADAALLADEAGRLLLGIRARIGDQPAAEVKDEGDRQSHELLVARLAELHAADAVLSEEAADDPARLTAARVWVIDPLDGTREFGEPPRTDWAVHVALVVEHQAVAGAVALPAQGLVLSTAAPRTVPPPAGRVRLVVSRTRPPASTEVLAKALDADLVPMGSAGAKAMAVVLGEADVYAHSGGQHEWDSAAPVAVAQACGLHCSRLDGSPLLYNQPDPWLPDLLVCRPELVETILGVTRASSSREAGEDGR